MIRHAWSVLCERVSTDRDTNNVTLNVMEQANLKYSAEGLKPGQLVNLPISGSIVSLWYKDEKERADSVKVRIRVTNTKGRNLGQAEGTVKFEGKPRARITTIFETMAVPQEEQTRVIFAVEYLNNKKWRKAAEIPFDLQITRIPSDQPQADQS